MNDSENEFHGYDPNAFEIEDFRDVIRSHWVYHGLCNMMNWSVFLRDDGVWQIEIAPPFQIVYGGAEDGKQVWTPFEFDIFDFLAEPDVVEVSRCSAMTYSLKHDVQPFIAIVGIYRGKPFAMRIHMEPDPQTTPIEIVDTLQDKVRPFDGEPS